MVNFATSRNLIFESMMFPHRNVQKYICNSVGKMHNQIGHFLIDRPKRRHSSTADIRSFRGDDCDIDHYLVVAEFRDRLSVSKRAAQRFEMERFNHKTKRCRN
jgi:hypothetical protein